MAAGDTSNSTSPNESSAVKSHPCDQCRRRKVRCDSGGPCDRCIQSGLRCTRDIARKRRGPKKGSGSVIAKLRDETDHSLLQNAALPQYDLPPLTNASALPGLHRTLSGDSIYSAVSSSYDLSLDSTSVHHGFEPRSVPMDPQTIAVSVLMNRPGGTTAADSDSPSESRLPDPCTSQYPSPSSSLSGFLTVNELAHRIFNDDPSLIYHAGTINGAAMQAERSHEQPSSTVQPAMDLMLPVGGGSVRSPFTNSQPSLMAQDLQQMPKPATSTPYQIEAQIAIVAVEVGVSPNLMSQCVKQYFHHLYPIMPAIHEATLYRSLNQQEILPLEEKCLLASLCAVSMVNAPPPSDLNYDAKKDIVRRMLFYVADLRRQSDWTESGTLTTIIVSFFVAITYFELKQFRSHHFYLREAIGMAIDQELHEEATYSKMTQMQEICHRRMFALLFVTERGFAIFRNKPILITRLPFLPTEHFNDENPSILVGFQCLCQLFALLDEKFVELWRHAAPKMDGTQPYLQDIASIQHDLNAMSFEMSGLPEIQEADVLVTQQWLRLIFWQASMRHGLVSSTSEDPVFFYDYPITIAKRLCEMMSKLHMDAVLVHGSGIVSTCILPILNSLTSTSSSRKSSRWPTRSWTP